MSYIVFRESEDAAKEIIKLLPLQELDYGSPEANQYAKTLPDSFFIRIYLQRNRGYNNTTEFELIGDRGIVVEYLVNYISYREEYTMTRNGHNILDRAYRSQEEFVKAAAARFTRSALLKFFKDRVVLSFQASERYKAKDESRRRREYEQDPKNWSKEKQEQRFAELTEYLQTTTDMYSDDNSVYTAYSDRAELHGKLRKLLGK